MFEGHQRSPYLTTAANKEGFGGGSSSVSAKRYLAAWRGFIHLICIYWMCAHSLTDYSYLQGISDKCSPVRHSQGRMEASKWSWPHNGRGLIFQHQPTEGWRNSKTSGVLDFLLVQLHYDENVHSCLVDCKDYGEHCAARTRPPRTATLRLCNFMYTAKFVACRVGEWMLEVRRSECAWRSERLKSEKLPPRRPCSDAAALLEAFRGSHSSPSYVPQWFQSIERSIRCMNCPNLPG